MKHSVNLLRNSYESNINIGNGFLLLIDGFTLSVIWSNANSFLFDSHSRDKDGKICENGLSVLLKFRSLNAVEKYVKEIYFTSNNLNVLIYEIQYIRININSISASTICISHNKRKHTIHTKHENAKKRMQKHNFDVYSKAIGTPEHEKRKEQMRKYQTDSYSKVIGTSEHEIRKEQMRSYSRKKNECYVLRFRKEIQEGPYYICVVCNRCLYKRSVMHFTAPKYPVIEESFFFLCKS